MNFIQLAIEANYELYNFLNTNYTSTIFNYTNIIGAGGDNSLEIDLIAEKIFIKHLSHLGTIHSEESGVIPQNGSQYKDIEIIIDPVDGSNNIMSSIPYYGSSIAFKKDGKVFASIICNLVNGDIYINEQYPIKANLNKLYFKPIQLNNNSNIGILERAYTSYSVVQKLQDNSMKFRSPGAMALSLANAHNLDFVIGLGKIREYDVAAGLHICQDLYQYIDDNLMIVSKDKIIFDKLQKILLT